MALFRRFDFVALGEILHPNRDITHWKFTPEFPAENIASLLPSGSEGGIRVIHELFQPPEQP
jgi:hypothetical protein